MNTYNSHHLTIVKHWTDKRYTKIFYAILFAFTLSCCRGAPLPVETLTPDLCSSEHIRQIITTMDDVVKRFDDVIHLAENTPNEYLEPIIKEMQVIRQEFEDIDTPPCATRTKAALDSYMESKIQCYFTIYAKTILETPLADRQVDLCSLASDQLEYYYTKMTELKVLLLEKSTEEP